MNWAHILAFVTGTVDQELLARIEYLAAENRILKALSFPKIHPGWESHRDAESSHDQGRCSRSCTRSECSSSTCSSRGAGWKPRICSCLSLLKNKIERAPPANLTRLGAHSDDVDRKSVV